MLLVYVLWTPTDAMRATIQLAIPVSTTYMYDPSFQFSFMIILMTAILPLLLIPLVYLAFIMFRWLFLSSPVRSDE
jgi:hypothetical protein